MQACGSVTFSVAFSTVPGMHQGPRAHPRASQSRRLTPPSKRVGLVLKKQGQAEASTLLHESSNSEPETIEQGEIVFHYIRVRVARVGVIPLVGTEPVTINKEHTHTHANRHTHTRIKMFRVAEKHPTGWGLILPGETETKISTCM